jgi:formyl-CoA transferase
MLDFQATRWTIDGKIPSQEGNHHPTSIPMGCFKTADGYMNIAGPWGRLWEQMCGAIGVPELLDDSRFLSGKLRSEHRDELNTIIAERLKGQTTADWVMILNTAGVPAGPVYSIDEVMADPQVSHLGMVQEVKHAELGTLSLIRNAVSSSRKSDQIRLPSPEVGENTEELLTEIGITKREFQALRNKGVV